MRTHGNGARVKSTVFVSTRAAVIGRATVGRTGKMVPQAVRVSFRGRLSWRPLSFQSGHSRDWHLADKRALALNGRYWTNNGQRSALGLNGSEVNDPTATSAAQVCCRAAEVRASP